MWQYNGKTIREGKAWTDVNGIQHPANWHIWTRQEKEAIGMVEIIPQTPPDSRFYNWSQNPDGTITSTPKPVEDVPSVDESGIPIIDPDTLNQLSTPGIKTTFIQEVKSQQGSLLAQTDWAVIRKTDTNIDIPANIQQWRNEIRLTASTMEDAISQATTIQDLENLMLRYTTNLDGTITKEGILFDWPELGE
jgi:hypothetical protein